MEDLSNYNVEVESILGGLESALARGQPLKKAMASFRNAGYKKENIEEAARKFQRLHRRRFTELGVDPNKPKKRIVGSVVSQYGRPVQQVEEKKPEPKKTLVPSKTREELIEAYEKEKLEMEEKNAHSHALRKAQNKFPTENTPNKEEKSNEKKEVEKDKPKDPDSFRYEHFEDTPKTSEKKENIPKPEKKKKKQVVSGYGDEAVEASENFREAIEEAVKSLSRLTIPVQKVPSGKEKPQVVNKISNYGMKPPTPVNKAITFLLIFLLILLLGALAAVFFFKNELIELFNNLSLQ